MLIPHRHKAQVFHGLAFADQPPCPGQPRAVAAPQVAGGQGGVLQRDALPPQRLHGQGALGLRHGQMAHQRLGLGFLLLAGGVAARALDGLGRAAQQVAHGLQADLGFQDILGGAAVQRLPRVGKVVVAGQDDDVGRADGLDAGGHLQPGHAGHLDVGNDDVGQFFAVQFQPLGARSGSPGQDEPLQLADAVLQPAADGAVVVHHKDFQHKRSSFVPSAPSSRAGMRSVMRVPCPGALSICRPQAGP